MDFACWNINLPQFIQGSSISLYFSISIWQLMLKSCLPFLPSSSKRRSKVDVGKLCLCEIGQMYQLQSFPYCAIWGTMAVFLLRVLRFRYTGSACQHTNSLGALGVPVWLHSCVQGWALVVKKQFIWVFKYCLCFQYQYCNNIFHFLSFFLFYKKNSLLVQAHVCLVEHVCLKMCTSMCLSWICEHLRLILGQHWNESSWICFNVWSCFVGIVSSLSDYF